ncbi:MAG: transcription termination factor NusA [Proteobacteria bacterium]|nr:transcription termination factor NusA [Pseudomonadota bacterium]
MSSNLTVMGNKEILLVADTIAHQKGILKEEVVEAMEEGIKLAAKKKYGHNLDIKCKIDKKTGQIKLFNSLEVINKADGEEEFDHRVQIELVDAKKKNPDIKVGEFIVQELPPIDLNRIVDQVAKGEIIKKVKEAEKNKEYEEFKDRVGDIVNASVVKVGLKNIVMDVEGFEAVIHQSGLISREAFKVGDRMRVYIEDVRREPHGAQIFLSRTHPQFLVKLFAQEVPELYDGNIEIKAIARDAGSRAKIAIYSGRDDLDIIGSFIGIRGSRVQSVSSELRGEKIDIMKWSPNVAELVVSALNPAKVSKVVVDEENKLIEVVVAEDQLSLAIGRGGQNVKLASQLVGYKIDVMTDEQESSRRTSEFNKSSQLFIEALDVEDIIANLLSAEGFSTVEEIAGADLEEIQAIEGFDEDIAAEIKSRAIDFLQNK